MVELPRRRPAVMGILNVTPDSFYDGGKHDKPELAFDAGMRMWQGGADIIDVGGESTRPGAMAVSEQEELDRTIPVVAALAREGVLVSIDTMKAAVASEALRAGAKIVNDVSAWGDPKMKQVCVEAQATVCLMHMQGVPLTMQTSPAYMDVVTEVKTHLFLKAAQAHAAGLPKSHIWIDPGIGFGKTLDHNIQLLREIGSLVATQYPVLVGISRKSFIGRILGSDLEPAPLEVRLDGALAIQGKLQCHGVKIFRTHDVQPTRRAVDCIARIYPI